MLTAGWSSLRALGNSRILRSSYFWVLLVPVAAKLLARVATVRLPFLDEPIVLDLPFSWTVFFFSGVATSIANAIYTLRCPQIVRLYETFVDYQEAGKGPRQMMRELLTLLRRHHRELQPSDLANTARYFAAEYCDVPLEPADQDQIAAEPHQALRILPFQRRILPDRQSDAFWYIRDFADALAPKARGACAFFFGLGLILAAVVFVQNVLFVLRYQLVAMGMTS